ncbi:uncharacterized protein TRUGW13939_02343 [Talaromyces rugulosus]|uniref:Glycosyl transferase CAP10 domain-containing protein n=1 Tax=Talaromyces rugulosus TaxID=121627 RepID=A0A7H8QP64_TALRU|nr:uncharacterized protein TRUGW13939_02343 [Talaromyces rugulosus]QKX55251.1 hypothetical protein TRUGW13939_02343 [Talaromyces rugulosus]
MAQPIKPAWTSSSRFPTIIRFRSLVIFVSTLILISSAAFFALEFKNKNIQLQLQLQQLFRNNHFFEKPCYAPSHSATELLQDGTWQHEITDKWQFVADHDGDNYALNAEQCLAAFPKLFIEIDKSVKQRKETKNPITFNEINSRKTLGQGIGRAMIYKGELYIIDYGDMTYTATRAKSTLNSLHRALVAMPDRESLPSIEFHFSADDFIWDNLKLEGGPVWSYSKRDTADIEEGAVDDTNIWLMPDFGYWAWPEVSISPYRQVRRQIAAVDAEFDNFQAKKKQLVWRGSLNTGREQRERLIEATKNKYWASVRAVDWGDQQSVADNMLPIEDHCRYMFVAHTEGRSFSGRGKYLLNCHSVFIAHTLIWHEAHHAALIASGPDANYVEVKRDFSDLEQKLEYLLDNPEVAERIANNSVRTFRDRYLTPAAEACYWRYLVRKWAEVCDFEPRLYDGKTNKLRGQPYEEWLLTM